MKRLFLLAGPALVLAVAGCDEPTPRMADAAPPIETPMAPSADDAAADVADTNAPVDPPPPIDNGQLPPANPSSTESVQPESETLFY